MLLAIDQTRIEQLLHVVRHRGLRQPERLDQVADADRLGSRGEQVDDLDPLRVAERLEELGRGDRLLVGERGGGERRAAGNG